MSKKMPFIVAGLSGVDDLLRVFDELPKALTNEALRKAGTAALQPVALAAQTIVRAQSNGSGGLAKSIQVSTKLSKRQKRRLEKSGVVYVHAGPAGAASRHAHLKEFGTRERWTKRKLWRGTRYRGRGPAEPFLRPAWDANQKRVLDIMRGQIWSELQKAAKRLRGRAEKGKVSRSTIKHFSR